ncbi:6,7-dimethyl-8-ribityllumazine synthase [Niabella ginsenosidivorans]|uniref:6,7-dimethyl-8-ribityllumazine synthase n=1 Tax=Niabella ginsenosidivorans TaxID=1176587 RepID=A0A1A9I2R2_9BACT|nr:6,7-dimethyl-8-ribityllumazine synthase [Niabella ginsenosidivorans]ANH81349.1 6,7-dimethyl-8-ribityllumazine synthase [Niabella ginsenosidivorans]
MATQGNSDLYNMNAGILKKDACVVLVKTEWNAAIVNELEAGCIAVFKQYGVKHQTLIVPGAVEITFAIKRCWERNKNSEAPDAFIALGCVIKGDTPHFDYVCDFVTQGVLQLNLMLPIPTIYGVLTVNTEAQAKERIGGAHGHKGEEAAITALKMINS